MTINSVELALLELDGRLLVTAIFKSLFMTSWERSGGQEMRNSTLELQQKKNMIYLPVTNDKKKMISWINFPP